MFEKLVSKKTLTRLVTLLLIGSILILTLSIFSQRKDGRRQIIDLNGSSEERLASVLSGIKGAGEVETVIEYGQDGKVVGVIVTAEGAWSSSVAEDLSNGVATLYDIPVSSVIVFEKEQGE